MPANPGYTIPTNHPTGHLALAILCCFPQKMRTQSAPPQQRSARRRQAFTTERVSSRITVWASGAVARSPLPFAISDTHFRIRAGCAIGSSLASVYFAVFACFSCVKSRAYLAGRALVQSQDRAPTIFAAQSMFLDLRGGVAANGFPTSRLRRWLLCRAARQGAVRPVAT
jgi:hypothetical protein